MCREDTIKRCDGYFLLIGTTFAKQYIAFTHHELFADRSDIGAEASNLQAAGIEVLQSKVCEAVFFDRLFLFSAVDCNLLKSIFRHYAHLLKRVA